MPGRGLAPTVALVAGALALGGACDTGDGKTLRNPPPTTTTQPDVISPGPDILTGSSESTISPGPEPVDPNDATTADGDGQS